jgi:hypothetical protein
MPTICSFDAVLLCWMYRTLESFGEDALRASTTFPCNASFLGKRFQNWRVQG